MGALSSKRKEGEVIEEVAEGDVVDACTADQEDLLYNPADLQNVLNSYSDTTFCLHPLATSDEVHHYIPANFPLLPVLNSSYIQDCNKTWRMICLAKTNKMREYGKRGIILFYDEFFHRLFQRDDTMEEVFISVRKRSEVLIKAMSFMLKPNLQDTEREQIANRCRRLGYHHRSFEKVKPHHFGIYVSTCIEVIMFWLGDDATPNIGEAWSNLVGFYLKHILQAYLFDKVDPKSSVQNTHWVEAGGGQVSKPESSNRVAKHNQDLEEMKTSSTRVA